MWKEDDKMMDLVDGIGQASVSSPAKCPICNEIQAHYLLHKGEGSSNRGTAWIWCDACKSYTHFGYFIPDWWKNAEFVDDDKLDSYVAYPQSIESKIDEWIGVLLQK